MKLLLFILYICWCLNVSNGQTSTKPLSKLEKKHLYYWKPKEIDKQAYYTNLKKCLILVQQDLNLATDKFHFRASQDTLNTCDFFMKEQRLLNMINKIKTLETNKKEKENDIYRTQLLARVSSSVLKDFFPMRY
jgi:hypothetical protein